MIDVLSLSYPEFLHSLAFNNSTLQIFLTDMLNVCIVQVCADVVVQ